MKRSQGRRKGPKNFRRRYFILTAKGLTYAKDRNDKPLCEIPASDLLAVERVDDHTFNMKFVSLGMSYSRLTFHPISCSDVSGGAAHEDTLCTGQEQSRSKGMVREGLWDYFASIYQMESHRLSVLANVSGRGDQSQKQYHSGAFLNNKWTWCVCDCY